MDLCTNIAESIPIIKNFSEKQKIKPAYTLLIAAALSVFIIQKTFLGNIFAALLSLYIPVREGILLTQSPNPKTGDYRRLLTVFLCFSFFYVLECGGIRSIVPLFAIMKIMVLFWIGYDEKHADVCIEVVFSKIPTKWLQCGNSIEAAVKKAARSAEDRVNIKKE